MSTVKNGKVIGMLTSLTSPNDVVKYGGYIYPCNTGHTAELVADGLEADVQMGFIFRRF